MKIHQIFNLKKFRKPVILLSSIIILGLVFFLGKKRGMLIASSQTDLFFLLDKTLCKSASLASEMALDKKREIEGKFEGHRKPLKPILYGAMDNVKEAVDNFTDYIESIKVKLMDESGNKNGKIDEGDMDRFGLPIGKENKRNTHKLLENGPIGEEIRKKMIVLRQKILDEYSNALLNETTLDIAKLNTFDSSEVKKRIEAFDHALELKPTPVQRIRATTSFNSWAEYRFHRLSLAAVLPLLSKFQNDARNAQALINSELASLTYSRCELVLEKYFPIMNPKKGYIVKGEKFESEVAIGSFSRKFSETSIIIINGDTLTLNDEGKASYVDRANSYGRKTLNMKAIVENTETGETISGTSSFDYEVGERSASLLLNKMNVFYIGVDNPFEVAIAGYSANEVKVSCIGDACKISGGNGHYIAHVSQAGMVKVKISAKDFTKTYFVEARSIPDPRVSLGELKSNVFHVGLNEFQSQKELVIFQNYIDFDVKCSIKGFQLMYVPALGNPDSIYNEGQQLSQETINILGQAKSGDIYSFNQIKTICEGDIEARNAPTLAYYIK